MTDFWEWLMPPKTPKQFPPIARLTLVNQSGQTITVSTAGTIPGKVGQGRTRTDSQLSAWVIYWGDSQQQAGTGPPPSTLTHTYDASVTSAAVRLVVTDANTLTASATLTVSLLGAVLDPPTNVTAVLQVGNAALISWTYAAGAASQFQIQRAISGNALAVIATVDGSLRQYTDTGLTAATTYVYAVVAVSSTLVSAPSATASVTTAGAPTAPSALLATAISSTQIDLAWTDNSSTEDGFQIERSVGSGFVAIATVAPGVVAYSDTGLTPSTAYTYRVRAFNVNGASAYTNTSTATTAGTVPAAPSGLSATAISASAITLAWTNNAVATSIRIERRIGAGAFSTLTTLAGTATSFPDTGLSGSTTYGYRVIAVNGVGDSAPSNIAEATTAAAVTAPTAPTGLIATPASASAINLSWTDTSSNEAGFQIERAFDVSGGFAVVATVAAGVTAYSDTVLAQSQLYRYRVSAYNSAGTSPASNVASATTQLAVPNAPTQLSAIATSPTAVHLTWTAPTVDTSHGAAASILVQRRIFPAAFATIQTVAGTATSYDDATAAPSTAYDYRLIAINASGSSSAGNTASVTTPAALPAPPAAPSALSAIAASATRVNLAWTDNSSNESGFVIQRSVSAGPFSDLATVAAGVTSYSDTTVVASTSYQYRVRAYNTGGSSANSNTASVTTPSASPPNAPTGLTATAQTTTSIAVAWTDPATTESGFSLERKIAGGVFAVIQTLAPNVTSYLDQSLTPSTTYTYRVRAFNANGNSAYSNEASATTPSAPPPSPPTCIFGVRSTSLTVGQPVIGDCTATPGSAPLATWSVTWGDGQVDNGSGTPPATISHTYTVAGTYSPFMHVVDTNALFADSYGGPITVSAVVPPPSGTDFGGYRPQIFSSLPGGQTRGGRGPAGLAANMNRIIRVRSLAATGASLNTLADGTLAGELGAALEANITGRFILPEISGYVLAPRDFNVTTAYMTLAGQTAPPGGINLRSASNANESAGGINAQASHLVFQHVRVRPGDFGPILIATAAHGAFQIGYTPNGKPSFVLLDHVSASWTGGKVYQVGYFDTTNNSNNAPGEIGFWKCIGSEPLWRARNVTPGQSGDGTWGSEPSSLVDHLVGTGFVSIGQMFCLLAHAGSRNPGTGDGVQLQFLNNLIYDWNADPNYGPGGAMSLGGSTPQIYRINMIGNRLITRGPYPFNPLYIADSYDSYTGTQLYMSDNTVDAALWPCQPFFVGGSSSTPWDPRISTPALPLGNILPISSANVFSAIQNAVGARPRDRDLVDARIISDVVNKTGAMITSQNQVGGYPAIASTQRVVPLPANPFAVADSVGRLNIEVFLETDPTYGCASVE